MRSPTPPRAGRRASALHLETGGDHRDDFQVHVISMDAYSPDGVRRLEDRGVTDCIVGFRNPCVAGPDTEPLERKVDGLNRFADSVIHAEQDLLEGYDYLAGRIRTSVQMAFDHDLDNPVLINSTHQFARQGLDNPDAVYFSAYLDPEAAFVVHGVRGTTADPSFQVMGGGCTADGAPESLMAFDDHELGIAGDGSFTWELGPLPEPRR